VGRSISTTLALLTCVLVTACGGGGGGASLGEPDGAAAKMVIDRDAALPRDGRSAQPDVALDVAVDAARALDGRAADRRSSDAGAPDEDAMPRTCMAGHTCNANARCQRACFGNLVYRCSCTEGHFICTDCFSVDAGARGADARGPVTCGDDVMQGRRCGQSGSVCQRPDDGDKLCVCGDIGQDRLWICQ
jgi:hypothetical protein